MIELFFDGRRLLAIAIVLAALLGAWMFRYEDIPNSHSHRNRITGVVCFYWEGCWFTGR
jgi:hypothetical protein